MGMFVLLYLAWPVPMGFMLRSPMCRTIMLTMQLMRTLLSALRLRLGNPDLQALALAIVICLMLLESLSGDGHGKM